MMSSGTSPLCAVDVLGDRLELLVGEAAEGVLHHLEVVVEVTGASLVDAGQELGGPEAGQEVPGTVERSRRYAPVGLAPEQLAGQLTDGIGHEGAGDTPFDVPLGAVVQQALGRGDRSGGVGQVIGEDLVVVDRTSGGQATGGGFHDARGDFGDGGGSGEIGCGHGARSYRGARSRCYLTQRQLTVTSESG
jgi:hypothetical protein